MGSWQDGALRPGGVTQSAKGQETVTAQVANPGIVLPTGGGGGVGGKLLPQGFSQTPSVAQALITSSEFFLCRPPIFESKNPEALEFFLPGRTLSYSFMSSLIPSFTYPTYNEAYQPQALSKAPESQRSKMWSCLYGTHGLSKSYGERSANGRKCTGWRRAL